MQLLQSVRQRVVFTRLLLSLLILVSIVAITRSQTSPQATTSPFINSNFPVSAVADIAEIIPIDRPSTDCNIDDCSVAVLDNVPVPTQEPTNQAVSSEPAEVESTAAEPAVQKPVNCLVDACLALTFDDGPDPVTTPQLLDALESEDAKATFFVLGKRIGGQEVLLQRMYGDGDEIGNHSWSHSDFAKLTREQMLNEINNTQRAMELAGVPPAHFFRPPYGTRTQLMRDTITLPMALWNVDPHDWDETDPAKLLTALEAQARDGAIMVLHDGHPATAAVLQKFIHNMKAKYNLVTVSELLQLTPDAKGEFFGHPPR